ncbi:zinc ribbon domain-containing protein [Cohnella lubricantis]|uniref:zinc ribbon domain-containing protein n=1 Tax=Cohnella lubricantis TaxID=2163172 RepID=UPI001FDA77A6|nr:zinc ribbon domain-containing protein [Cohnella lubricantis]MBP2117075.1 putative membrane protein YvbJ [Cohnella lubricantis]
MIILKKCPYCAEEIQDEAIKCKHCGSDLISKKPAPVQTDVGHMIKRNQQMARWVILYPITALVLVICIYILSR